VATSALSVVILALAAGLAVCLIQLHALSDRQSHISIQVGQLSGAVGQNASQNGGSVAWLKSQVTSINNQLDAISHYGVCLRDWIDNNGFVTGVNISTPVMSNNGEPQCPTGVFISAAPGPGN
jgi:hypothetical protein